MKNGTFFYRSAEEEKMMSGSSEEYEYTPGTWLNITFIYDHKEKKVSLYLNSFLWSSIKG